MRTPPKLCDKSPTHQKFEVGALECHKSEKNVRRRLEPAAASGWREVQQKWGFALFNNWGMPKGGEMKNAKTTI